jgi:PAS domain S-box-containing protein
VVKWTEDGKPLQAVGTHTDITERKRILESLTQSEEKLRTIADYTHDWEYWIDPEGKLVYVSPSCERITGYTAQEFMHYPGLLSTIVHPDDFSIACNHFEISQNDDDRSIQFRIVKRSGEVRWLSHFCRPVFGQDGTWLGRRASNHDITYEKEMAQALIENERRLLHAGKLESLAVMAGGIAHDFNNQLMALLGNLELALDDAPVGAKIRKRIENAILATDKLTALTHQMLAYTGQKYYRSDDLKLDEIIKDQMDSIRPDTPDNVTINIRDDIDAPMIRGDEDQIRRVLINLVTNAIEAIGDGIGQVNVSSGMMYCDRESLNQSLLQDKPAPGQFAFLQVDDNGCGMDEATRSKIFDPFFSTKFWGRGLGMPEMMGIVRSHKGAIFLNSRPDVGTTVRVIFPLPVDATPIAVDGIDHTEAQTQVSGDTQRQKTILVVEDEAEVRELCIELLQIFGYNTLSAEDGDEGVKKFRQHQKTIDLVLLDLMMPQMDGFEAFSQLVQIKPDVKVVISSGYTKEALVNKFQGVSPAGFLHKPYQMDRLLEELEKALGEPG